MLFVILGSVAGASDVNNPGGEQIPFVKLRSEVWDVVIRKTATDRARIERVKASCQGIWVNACAPGVDPELRQIALNEVFKDAITLSGDFTYCSTAVLRDIPADLARGVIEPSTEKFCKVFLDPESVRGMRSGNATQGENALVSRLMGSPNTTSGQLKIKAPPTVDGSQVAQAETVATGERRAQGVGAKAAFQGGGGAPPPQPVAPAPSGRDARVAAAEPARGASPPPAPAAEEDEWAFLNEPDPGRGREPEPPAPVPTVARAASAPSEPLFTDDEEDPVFAPEPRAPAPAPAPSAVDDDLAALLAPIPTIESKGALVDPSAARSAPPAPAPAPRPAPEPAFEPDPVFEAEPESKGELATGSGAVARVDVQQVVVPAPKPEPPPPPRPAPAPAPPPKPTGPSEFDLEAQEMASMGRLSDRAAEEEDKKKKKGKEKEEAPATVGGDAEFDNYIIIDIEGLED